jgi:hypothetical protein
LKRVARAPGLVWFLLTAFSCARSLGGCGGAAGSAPDAASEVGPQDGTVSDVFAAGSDAFNHDAADGSIIRFDSSSSPDGPLDGNLDGGGSEASPAGDASAMGTVLLPDCQDGGCTFPDKGAPSCSTAPPLTIVYPPDGVLVPPNMGIIDIQWSPNGTPYRVFEVDFSNGNTDWRMRTECTLPYQIGDVQSDAGASGASGGCYVPVQDNSWSSLASANRVAGSKPVEITVRGTTDGQCATVSNSVHLSFAEQDLSGSYYYWKSTVSGNGVGGQIWKKIFGDLSTTEQDVTSNVSASDGGTLSATCNGCHTLSRDGTRMVVYSDDNDSDDEYTDISGSLLDMTPLANGHPAAQIGSGANPMRNQQGGQPPGFTAIDPSASYYVSSNGMPILEAGLPQQGIAGGTSTSNGYPSVVTGTQFSVWDGMGNFVGPVATGCNATRPTMPDWSVDGKTVIFVSPTSVYNWSLFFGGNATDDDHISGGSFCTMPYMGNGKFGAATILLQSNGENNYYPSFSPDGVVGGAATSPPAFVLFNRVPYDSDAGTNCPNGFCPNDSFSNPNARLMLVANMANATPVDLEKANGSPASAQVPWSNSYPRWAPFVQQYKGTNLLWLTFSSTRDYGLRILNHKNGMYQCYPPDSAEAAAAMHGAQFNPTCQQPQLWMAPITYSGNSLNADPSKAAFWIPYQDMTTHNHMAQWTQ